MSLTDRQFRIHLARVYLAEAGRRRYNRVDRNFYWSLLAYAQKCRREASAMREIQQGSLFAC